MKPSLPSIRGASTVEEHTYRSANVDIVGTILQQRSSSCCFSTLTASSMGGGTGEFAKQPPQPQFQPQPGLVGPVTVPAPTHRPAHAYHRLSSGIAGTEGVCTGAGGGAVAGAGTVHYTNVNLVLSAPNTARSAATSRYLPLATVREREPEREPGHFAGFLSQRAAPSARSHSFVFTEHMASIERASRSHASFSCFLALSRKSLLVPNFPWHLTKNGRF